MSDARETAICTRSLKATTKHNKNTKKLTTINPSTLYPLLRGKGSLTFTADNQLNAKPGLSKDVRMQHFRLHKEDAINVNKVNLFRIYRWIFTYTERKSKI